MIYYSPIDRDPLVKPVNYSPKSCFVMTKLGEPIPSVITEIRERLSGNEQYKKEVHELSRALDLAVRAKNSVENIVTQF